MASASKNTSIPRGEKPRKEPARLYLDDKAYQKFRGVMLMQADYPSRETYLKAAWHSVRPTLEETGRRTA